MSRAYIYAELQDEMPIRHLRDQIYKAARAWRHYKRMTPHMTVVSAFQVKEGHEDEVKRVISESQLNGLPIEFSSVSAFTSLDEPYVVTLEVECDLTDEHGKLTSALAPHMERGPSKEFEPHVTLLKAFVPDETVPEDVKDDIQREVSHTPPPKSTKIDSLKCEMME